MKSAPNLAYRAKNIATVLVARFLQGAFGSTWSTMVGEWIVDLVGSQSLTQSFYQGVPLQIFGCLMSEG